MIVIHHCTAHLPGNEKKEKSMRNRATLNTQLRRGTSPLAGGAPRGRRGSSLRRSAITRRGPAARSGGRGGKLAAAGSAPRVNNTLAERNVPDGATMYAATTGCHRRGTRQLPRPSAPPFLVSLPNSGTRRQTASARMGAMLRHRPGRDTPECHARRSGTSSLSARLRDSALQSTAAKPEMDGHPALPKLPPVSASRFRKRSMRPICVAFRNVRVLLLVGRQVPPSPPLF